MTQQYKTVSGYTYNVSGPTATLVEKSKEREKQPLITAPEVFAQLQPDMQMSYEDKLKYVEERTRAAFNEGLEGNRDLNFTADYDLFDSAKLDALKNIRQKQLSNAALSPDETVMLEDAYAEFADVTRDSPNFSAMPVDTGLAPFDPETGEVILSPEMKALTEALPMRGSGGSGISPFGIQDVVESAAKLKPWLDSRPDAPESDIVKEALLASSDASIAQLTLDRLGMTAGTVEMFLRNVVPNLYTAYTTEGADTLSEEEKRTEFAKFRSSTLIPTRYEIVNDMIRDYLKNALGEEEFNKRGLGEKTTVTMPATQVSGEREVEVYKENFVSEQFANDYMEELFNDASFMEKVSTVVSENVLTFAALKSMYRTPTNAARTINRHVRKSFGKDIPPNIQSTATLVREAMEKSYATGVPVGVAVDQLIRNETSAYLFRKAREKRLIDLVSRQAQTKRLVPGKEGAENIIIPNTQAARAEIAALKSQLNATSDAASQARIGLQLDTAIAKQNARLMRGLTTGLVNFGFDPRVDVPLALMQVGGRNLAGGEPMGELLGVGAYLSGMTLKGAYNLAFPGPPVASTLAFKTRLFIEDTVSSVAEVVPALRKAHLQGYLVNPSLRNALRLSKEERARFSASELKAIDRFAKGILSVADHRTRDILLEEFDKSFNDIATIVNSVPVEYRTELTKALSLTVGEAAGFNTIVAIAHSARLSDQQFSSRQIQRMGRKIQDAMKLQVQSEERLAGMTAGIDMINRTVMRMEEGADPAAAMALDNLKQMATTLEKARDNGILELGKQLEADLRYGKQVLEALSDPLNPSYTKEAFKTRGYVRDLIEFTRRADSRYRQYVDGKYGTVELQDNVSGVVESKISKLVPADVATMEKLADEVEELIGSLHRSIAKAEEYSRLPSTAAEVLENASDKMVALLNVATANSEAVVKAAYAEIPTEKNVVFNPTAIGLVRLLQEYEDTANIARLLNPADMEAMAGPAGKRMLDSLNKGARAGMEQLLDNNPQLLEAVGEVANQPFATGAEAIRWFKNDYIGPDRNAMDQMGLSGKGGESISDAQLALRLMQDETFSGIFNPSTLHFIASPYDMELLRQGANKLSKSSDERKKRLGAVLRSNIDDTLEEWGQGLNVDAYNQLARARTLARLEAQRFDEGTLGYQIQKGLSSSGGFSVVVGDGEVVQLTNKNISALLKPLVDAVVNPKADSPETIRRVMQSLNMTFAPVSKTLPDQILTKTADGKFVVPETEDLARVVSPVMDETTFEILSSLIETALKNRYLEYNKIKGLAESVQEGFYPILKTESMPRKIPVPNQYKNFVEFAEAIEDNFIVTVADKDGNTTVRTLVDMNEIMITEREITNIVNSVSEYRRVHQELVDTAVKTTEETGKRLEDVVRLEKEQLKTLLDYANSTSPMAFFKQVIDGDNANSMISFLRKTEEQIPDPAMRQEMLQSLVTSVLREISQTKSTGKTRPMFNGSEIPVETMSRPDLSFELLDDAQTGVSLQGQNFRKLLDAAGVSQESEDALYAAHRYMLRIQSAELKKSGGNLQQLTKGFSLDQALSKAFNIARDMVSKEYVAGEVAIRYAAMSQDRMMKVILKDPDVAKIVYDMFEDPDIVTPARARIFAEKVMIALAPHVDYLDDTKVDTVDSAREYWGAKGLVLTLGRATQ